MDNFTFEKLILQNKDALYRISMSMLKNEFDAQDAVHDAILQAYQNLGKLRQEEYFKTWLIRILINCCHKQLRYRKRCTNIGDALPDIRSRDNPYADIEIGEAINALPPKLRLTVILFYVEDYSTKEISRSMQIPEGTVKSRLNKARKVLREYLGE